MLNKQASAIDPSEQRSGLRIYLLGPLRIEHNNRPIHLSRRKVEVLLAYLLLHPERQTRDYLATLFWGDSSDSQARHSLRTALAALRKEVTADLLLVDRDHVQLNPDCTVWTDLYELLATEDDLDKLNPSLLQARLALWQGELLAGFYEEWLTSEREHYRMRLLTLFLQVTQALRSQSDYGTAIMVAQQILAVDPASEQAHQHLMFCYVATGDRPAALRQYEQCERALFTELDAPPMPETTALYHWIKQQVGTEAAAAAKITNLPIPLTSFVGRTEETAAVKRLLNPLTGKTRLLTLTGAGGSGKTRLAIQAATDLIDRYAYGVWWVELAALTTDDQVVRAVAKALGVGEHANEALLQSVIQFLADKPLLLIIDNCEHLLAATAQFVSELLSYCPYIQIMTTSRTALNVPGETLWPVPTLALPNPQQIPLADLLGQFACIRLFVERASAVQPGFQLTLANALAVVAICTQLDGIPLAIELAAARVKVLPVEEIAARLTQRLGARFDLLTQGNRTAQPRQQTLRAAIDWSYKLLAETERQLFQLVAVFRGGFTLEALEQIVDAQSQGAPLVIQNSLDLLTQLVDQSLVIVEIQGEESRYRLLETLREYALEQLAASPELPAIHRRHAEFFLQWAEQAAPHLLASQQQQWLNRFEVEHPNLRAALDYWLAAGENEHALRLAVAAVRFWGTRGYVSEGRAWLQKALAGRAHLPSEISSANRAKALNAAGSLSFRQGDLAEAMALFQQSLTLFQQLEDEQGIAEVLQNMAMVEIPRANFALAQQYLEQSLALYRPMQDDYGIARAQQHLGHLAYDQDRYADARDYFVESLGRYRRLGDQVPIANVLLNLGTTLDLLGDFATAQAHHQECLTIARALGHQGIMGAVLRSLGRRALEQNEYAQARSYGEESLRLMRGLGDKGNAGYALLLLGNVARKQGDHRQALTYYTQNLQMMVALNYKWSIYDALEHIASLLVESTQQPQVAVHFLGAAQALRQAIGHTMNATYAAAYEQQTTALRQQLGESAFAELWAAGQTAPLAQLVIKAEQLAVTCG